MGIKEKEEEEGLGPYSSFQGHTPSPTRPLKFPPPWMAPRWGPVAQGPLGTFPIHTTVLGL